jgi:transposase
MKPAARSPSGKARKPAGSSGAKPWLRLRRWANLEWAERETVRELFALNRRLAKAYLLTEQLAQLWSYTYEAAAHRFLTNWLLALRWQRLPAFQKLARLLISRSSTWAAS